MSKEFLGGYRQVKLSDTANQVQLPTIGKLGVVIENGFTSFSGALKEMKPVGPGNDQAEMIAGGVFYELFPVEEDGDIEFETVHAFPVVLPDDLF